VTSPLLEVSDLSKHFLKDDQEVVALRDFTLTVEQGSFVTVLAAAAAVSPPCSTWSPGCCGRPTARSPTAAARSTAPAGSSATSPRAIR